MKWIDRYKDLPTALDAKGSQPYLKSARTADVLHVEKAASGKGGRITLRISTDGIDRANDKMVLAGINLDNYLKNPVVQWAHNGDIPAVAISRGITTSGGAMDSITDFHAATELSAELFTLYSEGYLKATSIGFIPLTWTDLKDVQPSYPFTQSVRQYDTCELLEYSCCNVPMNQGAVLDDGAKSFFKAIRKSVDEGHLTTTGELFPLLIAEYMSDARAEMQSTRKQIEDLIHQKITVNTPEGSPSIQPTTTMKTIHKATPLDQATAEDLTNQIVPAVASAIQAILTKGGYDFSTTDLKLIASDCAEDVVEMLSGTSDEPAEPAAPAAPAEPAAPAQMQNAKAVPEITDELSALSALLPLHQDELAIVQAALALPNLSDDCKELFTTLSEDTPIEIDEISSLIETMSGQTTTAPAPEGKSWVIKAGAKHSKATLASLNESLTHAKNVVKTIKGIIRNGTADPTAEPQSSAKRVRLSETAMYREYFN